MLDHVSLGTIQFEDAVRFYSECFPVIGYGLEHRAKEEAAFGPPGNRIFYLYPVAAGEPVVGKRTHVAVSADSKEKIAGFHARALEKGATTLHPPGPRPDIGPDYFGTVIRDLDGHTIEVVLRAM
jgi:catechol 2,3-dioxygenase-like lactoylglutathione lyase family enzyme